MPGENQRSGKGKKMAIIKWEKEKKNRKRNNWVGFSEGVFTVGGEVKESWDVERGVGGGGGQRFERQDEEKR